MAMFMLCETSVHAGSGSELGIVDLPIQRERHTDYPVFHSSSIKGALRFNVDRASGFSNFVSELNSESNVLLKGLDVDSFKKRFDAVFGEKDGRDDNEGFASAISVTDGRLLLFPVKSLKGTFAYVTCPFVLNRFKRDLEKSKIDFTWPSGLEFDFNNTDSYVPNSSDVVVNNHVTLEEFTFSAQKSGLISSLAENFANVILPDDDVYNYLRDKIRKSLVMLKDDDFKEFVSMSTEVVARIKVDTRTGTVSPDGGNLWYEENLPSESILYSIVFAQPITEKGKKKAGLNDEIKAEEVLDFVQKIVPGRIQLGGNETIGRGILTLKFHKKQGE